MAILVSASVIAAAYPQCLEAGNDEDIPNLLTMKAEVSISQ
jgi:hypothetical protein